MPKDRRPLSSAGIVVEVGFERKRDQLAELIDHCTSARTIADAQGERFLSYMLAMTIEAANAARDRETL